MDIRPPDHVMAWLGPIVLINIVIWIIAGIPDARQALCGDSGNCLMDWIGALSGWAGAIGAIFAAWWTVSHLRRQIEQQQAQIDFQLGDGPPLAWLEEDIIGGAAAARLRVQNWNRRPFRLVSLEASEGFENYGFQINSLSINRSVVEQPMGDLAQIRNVFQKAQLNGRSHLSDPSFADVRILFCKKDERGLWKPCPHMAGRIKFCLIGRLLDQKESYLRLPLEIDV